MLSEWTTHSIVFGGNSGRSWLPSTATKCGSAACICGLPLSCTFTIVSLNLSKVKTGSRTLCANHRVLQSLHIGSKIKPLYISDDPFPHELYRTPTSTNPESKAITSTMNYLFANKNVKTIPPKVRTVKAPIGGSHVAKGFDYGSSKPASVTAGTDQALAELQNSLAEAEARKQENTYVTVK